MMKTIFKYPLKVIGLQTISVPAGATFLSVHSQNNQPCIWALVDTVMPEEQVRIRILTTGEKILDYESLVLFIGTVLINEGDFVIHVFKEK